MFRQRFAIAWIACCAVLFNLLAMPLAGASAASSSNPALEQVMWGSFCSSSGSKLVAISLGSPEQKAPQGDDHSTMQHCWCCSGSAPLVALPGQALTLFLASLERPLAAATVNVQSPTPRQQWPSLNPRASPRV